MKGASSEARRFSRYGIVGLATNLSLYLVFVLLLRLGVSPLMSVGLCYGLGVVMSYLLNRRWTFASNDRHGRDLPKFLLAYGVGLVSTLLTISLLLRWLPAELAQIVNIGITAVVIYICLRLLRFGMGTSGHAY
jgi:putative flippase GtrA